MKNPPLFDGSSSWFRYEELIDDWQDITQLEAGRRGPALKNRLVEEETSLYKETSGPRISTSRRWSQAFQGYFEGPSSSKELKVFSSGDFFNLFEQREKTMRWSSGSASSHFC